MQSNFKSRKVSLHLSTKVINQNSLQLELSLKRFLHVITTMKGDKKIYKYFDLETELTDWGKTLRQIFDNTLFA